MDYKYIEQLLERYWRAETTLQEEDILRAFFRQEDVPAHLKPYQTLFVYEQMAGCWQPGEDFDQRVLNKIFTKEEVKTKNIRAQRAKTLHRLTPLFRATASVAIILLVGIASQNAFTPHEKLEGWDYNAAGYIDTYQKPQDAFEAGIDGIKDISNMLQAMRSSANNDTLTQEKQP